jgi:hypothetical protein
MNITEMMAASTPIQEIQPLPRRIARPNDNVTRRKIPMEAASEAEAKHTLQYFLLRQKIPPIMKNAIGTASNSMVGSAKTKDKVLTNPAKKRTKPINPSAPDTINMMPAAFLIPITYPTSLSW